MCVWIFVASGKNHNIKPVFRLSWCFTFVWIPWLAYMHACQAMSMAHCVSSAPGSKAKVLMQNKHSQFLLQDNIVWPASIIRHCRGMFFNSWSCIESCNTRRSPMFKSRSHKRHSHSTASETYQSKASTTTTADQEQQILKCDTTNNLTSSLGFLNFSIMYM